MTDCRPETTAAAEQNGSFTVTHVIIAALVLLVITLLVILVFLPWVFTGSLRFWELGQYTQATSPPDRVALVNTQIQATVAFVQLIGGVLLLSVLYTGYQSMRHAQEQIELSRQQIDIAQEGQITDRFTKAIEQLGATDSSGRPQLEVRLGGIYALERIARDSERDYWPIMEVMMAYIRQHASVSEFVSGKYQLEGHKPRVDIQAIMTVIGRRTTEQRTCDIGPIDLRGTDLRELDLVNAHLEGAVLREAHLSGSNLTGAQLQKANLLHAHMEKCNLWKSHMEDAFLAHAHLEGANLEDAFMQDAHLYKAHLEDAILYKAHLERAMLVDARLDRTNLSEAHLEDANLTGATLSKAGGLTQEQIDCSFMDDHTTLPSEPAPDGNTYRRSPRVLLDTIPMAKAT